MHISQKKLFELTPVQEDYYWVLNPFWKPLHSPGCPDLYLPTYLY